MDRALTRTLCWTLFEANHQVGLRFPAGPLSWRACVCTVDYVTILGHEIEQTHRQKGDDHRTALRESW